MIEYLNWLHTLLSAVSETDLRQHSTVRARLALLRRIANLEEW